MDQLILRPLDVLAREAKAVLDQADKAQTRADDLKITAGRILLEAKVQVEHGKWLDWLKEHKLGERRSQQVMRLASGKTTVEEVRKDQAVRAKKHYEKKKTHPKDAFSQPASPQPVVNIPPPSSSPDWDSDFRTQTLKADLQRVTRVNEQLTRERDDLKQQLSELGLVKRWAQANDQWDFIMEESKRHRSSSRR